MLEFIKLLMDDYNMDPGFALFEGWTGTFYLHNGSPAWIATPPKYQAA